MKMRTSIALLLCFLGFSASAAVTAVDGGDARAMNRRRLRKEESKTVDIVEESEFFVSVSTNTAPFASNDFDGHFDVSKESELAQFVVQSIRAAVPNPNFASNDSQLPQNFTSDGSNSPSNQPTLHTFNSHAANGEEPVSFTGTVWHDVNDNGRRDDDELGLAGYLIQVKACATGLVDNDVLVAFAVSAADGSYELIEFGPPGCYYVHLVRSDMTGGGMSQNFILESGGRVKLNAGIVLPTPTAMSSIVASSTPTLLPSQAPITMEPTEEPSNSPITVQPKLEPTLIPSIWPTTDEPSAAPLTSEPTIIPSFTPTTSKPSKMPETDDPTLMPSIFLNTDVSSASSMSVEPTAISSTSPTSSEPTMIPSFTPTTKPSKKPERDNPTEVVDGELVKEPTMSKPTSSILSKPTTLAQTTTPSSKSAATPTSIPTVATKNPSTPKPTTSPFSEPSSAPTTTPSLMPITTKPTVTATFSPTISHQPFGMPSVGPTISLGPSITDSREPSNSPRPSSKPTSKPVTSKPTTSPSYQPTTLTPTSITPSLVTSQPTKSNLTSVPTLVSTSSEPTIISSTTLVASQTLRPTAITTTIPPTEKTGMPSSSPALNTKKPTMQPQPAYVSVLPDFIKVTVLETEGELSMDATVDLDSTLDAFFGSKLTDYYNSDGEYFQSIDFILANQSSIEQQMREEPVRHLRSVVRRRMEGVVGTEILCHGRVEFVGKPPSSNEITDVITSISKEYNQELVSAIVDTGNAELSKVYLISVEKNLGFDDSYTRMPSSSPSIWSGTYPNAAQTLEQDTTATDLMAYAIGWSAMFAFLALLIFMFVNRRRADRRATHHARISTDRSALSAEDNMDDDQGSMLSVLSSVTDLNEYVHSAPDDNKQLHGHTVESDKRRRSSAAELNGRGTMTLQRDDNSVMPTSWLAALGSGNSPRCESDSSSGDETQYSRGGFPRVSANILRELRIEKDELLRQSNETVDVARILRKSKSAEKEVISDKSKLWLSNMISVVSPRSNTERIVVPGSDSSADTAKSVYDERDTSTEAYSEASSRNYREGAFPSKTTGLDWSYIGTVDEENAKDKYDDIEQQEEDQSKSESKSSSLNRFISDLVWLEERIADQTGKAASKAGSLTKLSEHDAIERSDSLSYKCDSFDSRSLSDNEVAAPSVIVNDCYIPPGEIGIEVASTKDGPVISCITDKSLQGHLNVGDLIMALDDRDTRSLSGEQLWSDLQTRHEFQRKLTLLHYGGIKTSDVKYMYA